MNLLSELNAEGTTIVMVTHSERDAGFATRTIQMVDGKILSGGILLEKKKII
jgi:putative ABC transport system ATP-binding protein